MMKKTKLFNPVDPRIEDYQMDLAKSCDNPVLLQMELKARKEDFPIVGRLVGLSLLLLAKSIGAQRVFEFGSGFGYSAYWFARAVGRKGKVICTDGNKENCRLAKNFLSKADYWSRIDFRVGKAQEMFSEFRGSFDICYNDVDKGQYPEIWEMARERIRPGGLYIADNVLWHGRVAVKRPEDIVEGWTEAIKSHNQSIFNDPDFDAFINPTRDGVIVARRK
ncbi:MAG: O-methyltransferase [Nitrospiria bacterium]